MTYRTASGLGQWHHVQGVVDEMGTSDPERWTYEALATLRAHSTDTARTVTLTRSHINLSRRALAPAIVSLLAEPAAYHRSYSMMVHLQVLKLAISTVRVS